MPSEVNLGNDLTFQAASGVSAITYDSHMNYSSGGIPQYTAVKLDASGAVPYDVVVATANDLIVGIAQTAPATGPSQSMTVRAMGVTKALAASAIAVGDQLFVNDSNGRLATVPAAGQTSKNAVGVALTPATAAGDVFTVLLQTGSQRVATA